MYFKIYDTKNQYSSVNLGVKNYKTHAVFQGIDQFYKTPHSTPTIIWVLICTPSIGIFTLATDTSSFSKNRLNNGVV